MSRKIYVAIVVNPDETKYFNNGLHQNAFYLHKLLQQIDLVVPLLVAPPAMFRNSSAIDTSDGVPDQVNAFGQVVYNWDLFKKDYHLDALLLISAAVEPEELAKFRENNVKIVSIIYGNRYVTDQETMIFGALKRPKGEGIRPAANDLLREDQQADVVWVSPHYAWQRDYIQHRYGADRSYVCPYVWDPELLELKYDSNAFWEGRSPYYDYSLPSAKSVFVTEPNVSVTKTTLFPLIVLEKLHNQNPDLMTKAYCYGAEDAALHNEPFKKYASGLNIVKAGGVTFPGRHPYPLITARSQVLFHHQFANALNYTMLEAAHLDLPVVHNSEFMKDFGYYYRGGSVTEATQQLERALRHGEREDLEDYVRNSEKMLNQFSLFNQSNIEGYVSLLANALDAKIEPKLPEYIVELEKKLEA